MQLEAVVTLFEGPVSLAGETPTLVSDHMATWPDGHTAGRDSARQSQRELGVVDERGEKKEKKEEEEKRTHDRVLTLLGVH